MRAHNMENKNVIKMIFIILLFTMTQVCFSQETMDLQGPNLSLSKKEFIQEIYWDKDKFASEYEVEIQDENFNSILVKRTKETKISFSIPHGNYRYRIFSFDLFGNKSQNPKWKELKIIKAIKPIVLDQEEKIIYVEQGHELELSLKVKGFSKDTKLKLFQYDRKKSFDLNFENADFLKPEFLALQNSEEKIVECKLKINPSIIREEKYFLRAENPGNQIFEGFDFKIQFIVRPVIINFFPSVVYCIKGSSPKIELTVQHADESCNYFLVSEEGKKILCKATNIEKNAMNSKLTLVCSSCDEGNYSIRVESKNKLFAESKGLKIQYTVQPHLQSVSDGIFRINTVKNFDVEFCGVGILDTTIVKLVPKDESKKKIFAKKIVMIEDGKYKATFSTNNFAVTDYFLEVENYGQLKDTMGKFSFLIVQGVDVNLGLGIYGGSIILLYNDSLPDYTHATFSLGEMLSFSIIPFKHDFGYLGFGIDIMASYWQRKISEQENKIYSGIVTLSFLYQKPFFSEKLRLQLELGGGYSIFGHTVIATDEREFAQCPVFKTGAACIYYPIKNLFLELGFDYFHLFAKDNYSGLLIPQLSAGVRF